MKTLIALLILAMGLTSEHPSKDTTNHVVLPNPNLIECASSPSQLWQDENTWASAVHPVQLQMDHFDGRGCPKGIVALYGKAVSVEDIRSALDRRYRKWAKAENSAVPVKLWRVESEKFGIQLSTIANDRGDEAGMKQLIYLSFAVSQGH